MWTERCKQVHLKNKDDPTNATHQEIQFAIRKYLGMDSKDLSSVEKRLHLNVKKGFLVAHTTTLLKWLRLLAKERELTIRNKRENGRKKSRLQPITKFFRRKA